MKSFYKIPLTLDKIITCGKHPKAGSDRSIKDFLELIILTTCKEVRRDETFGCEIWEKEFEVLPLDSRWQNEIKQSITEAVKRNETRLQQPKIDVRTEETSQLMTKIIINISGKIKQTGDPFEYDKTIYLCPQAVD